jgi:hypothetical protein
VIGLLLVAAFGFHLNKAKVIGREGDFLRKRTRLGDVYLHREHDEGEEVVLEENFHPLDSEETYRELLNTVVDVTQNPRMKKDFLQCSKGKSSEFFKFGAQNVGYIGNKSNHEAIYLARHEDDCFEKVLVSFENKKFNNLNTITVEMVA